MSDSKESFIKIKLWFSKLVTCKPQQQIEKIHQLILDDILDESQAELLKKMLSADKTPDMPENISGISDEISNNEVQKVSDKDQQVGPYKITGILGQGGMGRVFLAKRNDGNFSQTVALKLPNRNLNAEMQNRFENERQILAQLNHNNIARLLDGGTTKDHRPYLAMEYIVGKTIDEYCIEKLPNLSARIELIIQTCQAVSFAHQNLILHRDLKPGNILVTNDGNVKLLDFGIAKLLDPEDEVRANQTVTQIMTRNYASPEQIQGKPVSTHSDMFSLAVIAYELITGFHPFKHKTQLEREQNLISGKIMRITERSNTSEAVFPELAKIQNGKIAGDLENILIKALSIDPQRRYTSIQAFADDLQSFLQNKPITARKPSVWYIFTKLIQRHKTVAFLIFITLATLIFATVYSLNKADFALKQQLIAEGEKQKALQISDFLTQLFKNAKPMSSKQQVTAQDLLLQGFESIDNASFTDPEVKYELLNVIHNSMQSLGKISESGEILDKHLQECEKILSIKNEACVKLIIEKSRVFHFKSDSESSLRLLKRAETIALSRIPQNKQELLRIYSEITPDLLNLEKNEEAMQYMYKIIDIENQLKTPDYSKMFEVTHELATIEIFNREFKNAWHNIERNEAIISHFPEKKRDSWRTHHYGLKSLYFTVTNDAKLAFENRKKRLDIESKFEVKPRGYGRTLFILGDLAIRAGYFSEAEKYLTLSEQFYKENVSDSLFQQYMAMAKKSYLFSLTGNTDNAQMIFNILAEAQTTDPNLHGFTDTSYYMKAKNIIDFTHMNVTQAEQRFKEIEPQLMQAKTHMQHHELYVMLIKTRLKLIQGDKQAATTELNHLIQALNQFPNDYFGIKKAAEILRSETTS